MARMRGVVLRGSLAAVLPWLSGCGPTQVVPPAGLEQPAEIFVLDHGRHTSLVVSTPEGAMVRYAYGDWRFYAERLTGPGHALAALLWSTPGALGRRQLAGPPTPFEVRLQVPLVIVELHRIHVERARVEVLRARLDAIFDAAEVQLDVPEVLLVFVPHPRPYNLVHNSNRAIADWLVELGCEIDGRPILARWRFEAPAD